MSISRDKILASVSAHKLPKALPKAFVEPKPNIPRSIPDNITVTTTCVNYTQVLERVIDSWKSIGFNKIIVVTSYKDHKTIKLTEEHSLKCIKISSRNKFIRARYINSGIQESFNHNTDWILSLDCDVYFPYNPFNRVDYELDYKTLYGVRHVDLNLKEFDRFITTGKLPRKRNKPKKVCMGPFQLFSKRTFIERNLFYPDAFNVDGRGKGSSWHFARKFKHKRALVEGGRIFCCNLNMPNGV